MELFQHLDKPRIGLPSSAGCNPDVHPAVKAVGLQMAAFTISGSNARCIAMLNAFSRVIADYVTPKDVALNRHLNTHLSAQITYLRQMRPMSMTMANSIRWLKGTISNLDIDRPDDELKATLLSKISDYIRDHIVLADEVICEFALRKIQKDDVILVCNFSSIVLKILLEAHEQGIPFRVIVVDVAPRFDGRTMLDRLVTAGIRAAYTTLHGAGYVVRAATKVLLGAHSMLSNGAMMARAGTASVAMLARELHIPVLVACETYKFSDSVQLDAFVKNEIANPDELLLGAPASAPVVLPGAATPNLQLLNLRYDITPPEFLSAVVTEVGILPVTSIPVVVREYKI
ncbi:IF-2B-domain-containing protein [Ramicandelaber brevisporus]|nr:IF-2B-domain-containing protein [Ramicandelaber brevisporus]